MSTVFQIVDAANDAAKAGEVKAGEVKAKRWKPSGKKVYKPRMATKVKWALGDTMKQLVEAEERMDRVQLWLEKTYAFDMDERTRAHLGELAIELLGVARNVSKAKEIVSGAMAESGPAEKKS